MVSGSVGNPPLPVLQDARSPAEGRVDPGSDDRAVLRAMQAGGGLRLLGLRVVIVLVLLMAAQAYDGSLHALSHWLILGLYGLGTVWFGLGERSGGPRAEAYSWAGTLLNAGLAVYVIIEHMLAGGGAGLGADAVSRLPAFLLLLQTGLSMRVAQTLLFCGLVTACWSAAFLVGVLYPELFPGPDTFPTAQITGLATFAAAGLLVVDGTTRLRAAVTRALRMEHERTQLARFVPDTVALDLAAEDGDSALGVHRRHACLMILDIRGFSRLSREHPPEAMVTALLAVRAVAQAAVSEQGGVVDKYIGDAVLAQFVFGQPGAQAQAALACTLSIRRRMAALNAGAGGPVHPAPRRRPARGRPSGRGLRRRRPGRIHGAGSGDERPGADRDPGQGGRDRGRGLRRFPGSARRGAPRRPPRRSGAAGAAARAARAVRPRGVTAGHGCRGADVAARSRAMPEPGRC
jgi:adenylate cyclase